MSRLGYSCRAHTRQVSEELQDLKREWQAFSAISIFEAHCGSWKRVIFPFRGKHCTSAKGLQDCTTSADS